MKKKTPRRQLVLRTLSANATRGVVEFAAQRLPCAVGRSGQVARKCEGDGATPLGRFRLLCVYYRPDRLSRPRTALCLKRLRPNDGWCDAAGDRNYNRMVLHPYPASAERLWRADGLYDVVVVLDHNQRPRVQGAGSAIFMHVAREGYKPTEGCIAMKRGNLLRLISGLGPGAAIRIGCRN